MAPERSVDELRAEVVRRVRALPEAVVEGDQHLGCTVRGRRFAWFLVDHHGDGRVALDVKAAPGEQEALVAADPERYFVPSYVGARGWVGVRLDGVEVDWDEVGELLLEGYRLVAPKRLAAAATAAGPSRGPG